MSDTEHVWDKHETLFHYTNQAGLLGILNSNDLWASSYKFLNDREEVVFFKKVLRNSLLPFFERNLRNKRDLDVMQSALLRLHGYSNLASQQADEFIDVLYKTTFQPQGGRKELVHPFFVSFCSHSDSYEKKNGLLSQWRGYGSDGGFAIEFDVKELSRQIQESVATYERAVSFFCDVFYCDTDNSLPSLNENIECIVDTAEALIRGRENPFEKSYGPFVTAATRTKHIGFREEQEFRVVIAPILQGGPFSELGEGYSKFKKIYVREGKDGLIPYIKLLEEIPDPLPIRRVIVGPCRQQQQNYDAVSFALEGAKIEVTLSETPYVG
ncbi:MULTISPECIES: DUF2971 domain-containing protein [Thalassospira]|uniref:DUF2971 domain-containing protein n=1 Tax=Thalassospira TaxID=168934 RepID=UPI000B0A0021|nr:MULTISPECIES: DUF2971 domain-containing protein [Thalassospira]